MDTKDDTQNKDFATASTEIEHRDGTHVTFEAIDEAEERQVVRKLDLHVLPLMTLVYFCMYLDKQSITYAAIFGLRSDLNLTGEEYSWCVSVFYLGQLLSNWPAAYLLGRLPLKTFIGCTIVVWGVACVCVGLPHNFGGMMAARFFLGLTEGAVSPAFVMLTSVWYKRREHPVRVATWVSMNGFAQITNALIMFGLGRAKFAIESWRVLFYLIGGLTVTSGLLFYFLLPGDTTTAWFLTPRQREIATRRLAIDRSTRDRTDFNRSQFNEAYKSPITWLYVSMALGITLTTAIIKFSSIVINGFGYDKYTTMLVGLPGGGLNILTTWFGAFVPRLVKSKYSRTCTALFLCCIPLLGAILLATLPASKSWGIVVSTWMANAVTCLLSSCSALMASNVKGNTKKSSTTTMFFVAYCVGCIISPQAWTEDDAPRYLKGCILSIASLVYLMITLVVYAFLLDKENKLRDRKAAEGHVDYMVESQGRAEGIQSGVAIDSDLTDRQDKAFRYIL
ncbi:major facilitator superfamily domain-containing protein [Fusarium oxysporum]|nr:major facilitator superfamily domain-containing protein [Fusarium oxysporum]